MFGRNCGSSCSSRTTWAMVPGPTSGAVPSAAATRCKKSWRRETGTRGRAEEALASIERVRKKARAEAVKLTRSLGRTLTIAPSGSWPVWMKFCRIGIHVQQSVARRRAPPGSQPVLAAHAEHRRRAPRVHCCPGFSWSRIRIPWRSVPRWMTWRPCGRRVTPSGTGSRRRRCAGSSQRDRRNTRTFGTTMDDGAIVLVAPSNSRRMRSRCRSTQAARAARGRTLLEPVLTGLVRAPLIERQTVEQVMASPRDGSTPFVFHPTKSAASFTKASRITTAGVLDEPIPSLGNQSPRKAAKTAKGRGKVVAWLKMLENHSAHQGRDDPVGSYDFTWIWKELGLDDERR